MSEFQKIAGYESIKEEGRNIIRMIKEKDSFLKLGARNPRGYLFYGAPGMGKTVFAKELIKELKMKTYEISTAEATRLGVAINKLIIDCFTEAMEQDEAVIFIDELDKIAGTHLADGFGDMMQFDVEENFNTEKLLMQSIDKIDSNKVTIIATANNMRAMDRAFLRTGRFDRRIYFNLPNEKDRKELINFYLKDVTLKKNFNLDLVIAQTDHSSCSDIECICNEAIINACLQKSDALTNNDFYQANKRLVLQDIPGDKSNVNENKFVAIHEAGHALVSLLLNKEVNVEASIISQGVAGGITMVHNMKKDEYYDIDKIKEKVMISLAGMAAVEVLHKKPVNGNGDDLEKASSMLAKACSEGLFGIKYANANSDEMMSIRSFSVNGGAKLTPSMTRKILKFRNKTYKDTKRLLKKHQQELVKISDALLQKHELNQEELLALMN